MGGTGYQATGDLTLASAGDLTVGAGHGARTSGGVATLMAGNSSGLSSLAGNLGATPASGGVANSQLLVNGPIHACSGSFFNVNLLSTGQVLQDSSGTAGMQTTHTSGNVTTKGGMQVVTFRDVGSPVTLHNALVAGTSICGTSTGGVGTGNCVGPLQIETRLANGTTAQFAAGDIKYNSINGTNIFGVGTAADVAFIGPSQTVSKGNINGRNVFFCA